MKSAKQNQKRESLLCFSTSCIFAVLLFSAVWLEHIPLFFQKMNDQMISNALPFLIAVTFLVIQIYINSFWLRQRGQEFAQYMLAGLTKRQLCQIYGRQYVSINGRALLIGLSISFAGYAMILLLSGGVPSIGGIISAVGKQLLIFSLVCLLAFLYIVKRIRRLSIHLLINQKKMHEPHQMSSRYFKRHLILFCLSLAACLMGLIYFDPFTMSVISVFVILLVYEGYRLLAVCLQTYRTRWGKGLYKKNYLFLSGQLLSHIHSWIRLSTLVSICCLVALVSFVLGIIMVTGKAFFFEDIALDKAMGIIQIYISILFTIVIFVILSIRQMVDVIEHNQQFLIMRSLGKSKMELDRILITQIAVQFIVPFMMAMGLLAVAIIPIVVHLGKSLTPIPVLVGIAGYIFLLILLGLIYVYITFSAYKRSQTFYVRHDIISMNH